MNAASASPGAAVGEGTFSSESSSGRRRCEGLVLVVLVIGGWLIVVLWVLGLCAAASGRGTDLYDT